MSRSWDTSSTTQNGQSHGQTLKTPLFFLRNLYGHAPIGLLWERRFEEFLLELGWEKSTELGMLLCSQKTTTISFQYTWMILTWLERRRIWLWCGRKLMQNVDLDETISFLDYVYLECTQRECKQNEIIIGKNLTQRPWRGPTTWKDTLKKCVERYCELANKKTEQLHKVSSPCLDDHQTEVYSQTV